MFTQEDLPMMAIAIIAKKAEVEELRQTAYMVRCGSLGPRYRKMLKEAQAELDNMENARKSVLKRYGLKED